MNLNEDVVQSRCIHFWFDGEKLASCFYRKEMSHIRLGVLVLKVDGTYGYRSVVYSIYDARSLQKIA